MAKANKEAQKIKAAVARSAARNDSRSDIEIALGRKMHQIGKMQDAYNELGKKLKALHDEASELDEELKKLDG